MAIGTLNTVAIVSVLTLTVTVIAVSLNTFTLSDNSPLQDGKSEWGFDNVHIEYTLVGEHSADYSYSEMEDLVCFTSTQVAKVKLPCDYLNDLVDGSNSSMAFYILCLVALAASTGLFCYFAMTKKIITKYGKPGIAGFLVATVFLHVSLIVWFTSAHEDISDWIKGTSLGVSFWLAVLSCFMIDLCVFLSYKCIIGGTSGYLMIS